MGRLDRREVAARFDRSGILVNNAIAPYAMAKQQTRKFSLVTARNYLVAKTTANDVLPLAPTDASDASAVEDTAAGGWVTPGLGYIIEGAC